MTGSGRRGAWFWLVARARRPGSAMAEARRYAIAPQLGERHRAVLLRRCLFRPRLLIHLTRGAELAWVRSTRRSFF